jgi:hypothetical protein
MYGHRQNTNMSWADAARPFSQYFTCTRTIYSHIYNIPARRIRVYKGGATKSLSLSSLQ